MSPKHPKEGILTNRTTRRNLLQGAGAVVAALSLPASPAVAQTARGGVTRIRYAHSLPTNFVWQVWGEAFKTAIEKNSAGKIQVTIFPNAQMGDEAAITAAVRLGSLEMGSCGSGLMKWVPEASVTDAPFLFTTRKQCYGALDGALGDALKKLAANKGFKLLTWHDAGFRSMTNNKHPITAAKDLASIKMRAPNSKAYVALFQAMGATVVSTDASELYLALSQGLADGQDMPPSGVKALNLFEVQKYISKTDHILTTSSAIMNPDFFEKMPADQQKMVMEAVPIATAAARDFAQKDESTAYEFCTGKGMILTDKVDGESFRKVGAEVTAKFPDLFPPELIKLAMAQPT